MGGSLRMRSCSRCKKSFEPKKTFHHICNSCIKTAAKCKTCNKIVFEKNGYYECCGHSETKPSRLRGRSLEEMIFILETGLTPEQCEELVNIMPDVDKEFNEY